jgi:hypothetical protein
MIRRTLSTLIVSRRIAAVALACLPAFAQGPVFTPGNLVVVVEGCGAYGGTCTSVPSGTGQYLTLMGYGINAPIFDAAYFTGFSADPYGAAPSGALAQSGSLTGQSYAAVPRVVTLIDANGNVNSSAALFNVFNTNNPRSTYTADGTNPTAWVSGQGSGCDATGGVFYTALGAINNSPTAITGIDAGSSNSCPTSLAQDTRALLIDNNTLYVAVDSKEGNGNNRSYIGTLGPAGTPATSLVGAPVELSGFGNTGGTGKITITSGTGSDGNSLNNVNSTTRAINLSPVNYFFASPSVLYVADSGNPKNDSNGDDNSNGSANIGDGGLQKWMNTNSDGSGTWSLKYTLYQGLNLVNNGGATGTTGLYGLAGQLVGSDALLYATNYTLNDLDQTYLFGVTDVLLNTTPPGTSLAFTKLDTAPADSNFKGLSFAPSIPAASEEITSSPSGLAFSVSGAGCGPAGPFTTPATLHWTARSSCTLSVVTPQTQSPAQTLQTMPTGIQYAFSNWEDGTASTSHTVTAPSTSAVYTATFETIPIITWTAPAAMTFGGALSAEQLNATASVPGTFVYAPAAGTVLPVGAGQTLSATFTPNDTVDYTTASASTTITVNPAPPPALPANLIVTKVLSRTGGNVVVQITIANTGGADAPNVVLNSVKVGADTATPLPQSIGTVGAGSSAQATVSVPASVGASGAASSLTLSGAWNGGTFGSSARIVLP